jgi:hypothetical protein
LTLEGAQAMDWLREELDRAVASYQTPHERRVGYGNLRHEYSSWKREAEEVTNVAIVYETPGGSTTQLNVTYNHSDGSFAYLTDEGQDQVVTHDPVEVVAALRRHVDMIPAKRQAALNAQVEEWMGAGKQVFAELNKLLQTQFLGGRITTEELKASIQHAIKCRSRST